MPVAASRPVGTGYDAIIPGEGDDGLSLRKPGPRGTVRPALPRTQARVRSAASAAGRPSIASRVDTVTSPAT